MKSTTAQVLILSVSVLLLVLSVRFLPITNVSQSAQVASSPSVSFISSSYTVEEGKTVSIKIKADTPIERTTKVRIQAQSGTARSGSDFTPLSTTVTFYKGGLTTKSIVLKTIRDSRTETNESLTLKILSVNGVSQNKTASVQITDKGGSAGSVSGGPEYVGNRLINAGCGDNTPCDKKPKKLPKAYSESDIVTSFSFVGALGSGSGNSFLSVNNNGWSNSPCVRNPNAGGCVPGVVAAGPNPGLPQTPLSVTSSSNQILSIKFQYKANEFWKSFGGIALMQVHDGTQQSANFISISKLPGDFGTNIPDVCKHLSILTTENHGIIWASRAAMTSPTATVPLSPAAVVSNKPYRCILDEGGEYYFNIAVAAISGVNDVLSRIDTGVSVPELSYDEATRSSAEFMTAYYGVPTNSNPILNSEMTQMARRAARVTYKGQTKDLTDWIDIKTPTACGIREIGNPPRQVSARPCTTQFSPGIMTNSAYIGLETATLQ